VSRPDAESSRWFADEVQPHEPMLRSYLRGAFPSVRDVDDVVQESFFRIWRTRSLQPVHSAKAFLFQIARRLAIDSVRRERASPVATQEVELGAIAQEAPDVATALHNVQLRRRLVAAVVALPPRYREIVLMRKFEELPQKVVAERLGLSERTVENLLARGLKKVEARLRDEGWLERY
jgi:RNA polymerase sigma-70 factor (ECF subfamily)